MPSRQMMAYLKEGSKSEARTKAIHAKKDGKTTKVLGHTVREGSKKHSRLVADKKRYDDLAKSER